jgi:glycosyltransferase involved in cell wall biosynthesis
MTSSNGSRGPRRVVIACDGPVPHRYMNFRGDVLMRGLASRAEAVHVVCPASSDEGAGDAEHGPVTFHHLRTFRPVRSLGGILDRLSTTVGTAVVVARLVRRERVDCIRTISTWPTLAALLARGRRRFPPVVANLSDFYGDLYRGAHLPLPGLAGGLISRLERLAVRADVVLVDTPEQRDRWVGRRGLDPERCVVVPHGLPRSGHRAEVDPPDAPRVRARFAIPADVPIVLHLGDIGEMDGVDLLLRAAARLRTEERVALLLVGQGAPPYVEGLRALAEDLGVASDVHWIERVPNAALPALLAQVDVCVAPFRIRDTSATAIQNKVLEYLTSDRPIVATGGTALEHAIGAAAAYCLADDPDSLAKALLFEIEHGCELRHEQVARRRELSEALAWPRIVERESAILEAVVSGRRAAWQEFDYVVGGDAQP